MRLRDVWLLWTGLVLFIGIGQVSSDSAEQQLEDKYNWWQHEVFYQIYPRSFKDSDGDGIGDLKGITSKLEYFVQTGITAVWLSPIYESPMVDFGYDISNYTAIQPEYGTLDDFDELIAKAKRLGIKVILDFVPNHSSDQHDWFKKSVAREPGYKDFYVWEDGKKLANGSRAPPNNWRSVFDGSAWEWNEQRQQYYLRQFTAGQPDLNYRNPAVVEAMDNVMLYWLNKGIAGFRIDAVIYVYENEALLDEPLSGKTDNPNSVDYLQHIYTQNLPEDIELIQHWRQLLHKYSEQNDGPERIMMTEGYSDLQTLMKYYEDDAGTQGAQFPFNFDFITSVNAKSTAHDFVYHIQRWLTNMPAGHAPNWVMGNHDNPRVGSRFGAKSVDAMNMLLLTLPGIAVTYYGEELGMLDYRDISWEQTVDSPACEAGPEKYKWISRDPERTPMQWSDEPFAGFSSHASWLPVHPNYKELNVRAQQQANRSHYQVYKSLLSLRKDSLFRKGNFIPQVYNNAVFAFKRQLKDRHSALTIINVSNSSQQVDLSDLVKEPNLLHVLATTVESQRLGEYLEPSQVALEAYEGLVVQLKDVEQ